MMDSTRSTLLFVFVLLFVSVCAQELTANLSDNKDKEMHTGLIHPGQISHRTCVNAGCVVGYCDNCCSQYTICRWHLNYVPFHLYSKCDSCKTGGNVCGKDKPCCNGFYCPEPYTDDSKCETCKGQDEPCPQTNSCCRGFTCTNLEGKLPVNKCIDLSLLNGLTPSCSAK